MRAKPSTFIESTFISWKSRASNLIVLVESEIKHETFNKNLIFEQYFEKKYLR